MGNNPSNLLGHQEIIHRNNIAIDIDIDNYNNQEEIKDVHHDDSSIYSDHNSINEHSLNNSYSYDSEINNPIHNQPVFDEQPNNRINYQDENLGYEELLRLDDNVKHPLSIKYLSELPIMKMDESTLSKLDHESRTCTICYCEFKLKEKYMRIPCMHLFHADEITKWFSEHKTCPVCRVDMNTFFDKWG